MDIILYLIQLIQQLYKQNCWLIQFICKYIPLKKWAFDDSHSPNAYYKKKRAQGKHHLTATGAVVRKLTTVIYAVLRDGKPYEPKKFC